MMLTASGRGASQDLSTRSAGADEPVKFLSMVELLVRPVGYEGALIEVTGFYGGVPTALFLTRDHAEINDLDSGFFVTDETEGFVNKHCAGHYVRIEGRFKRRLGGLPGSDPENFEIDDVTRITILVDGKETTCWPPERTKER